MPTRQRLLRAASVATLTAELARRQRLLPGLQRRHDRLLAEATSLAAEIEAMGGMVNGAVRRVWLGAGTGPRRAGTKQTLADALAAVLKGRTLAVTEAADAVLKAGYRTKSGARNFRVQVNITLIKDKRFKRVGRGMYTVEGGATAAAAAEPVTDRRRIKTGRGSRPARPGSVASTLLQVLKSKTMTVSQAVAAVRAAGFKTKGTAKSFYHGVAFALGQSGRFRRVSRGKYTAKA